MPRSGTSWLAQIFASHPDARLKLDPLFSYAFKNAVDADSSDDEWISLFDAVATTADEYMDQDFLRRDGLVPTFTEASPDPEVLVIKANRHHTLLPRMLDLDLDLRQLLIVRDPRATIASWVNNPTEFPADADVASEWRTGACRKDGVGEFWGFDDWLTITRLFVDLAAEHPDRVTILRYEEILADAQRSAATALGWAGLDLHPQTEAFIRAAAEDHDDRPRSVFKAPDRLAARRLDLDPDIQQQIVDETVAASLGRFLDPVLDPVSD